MLLDHPTSEVRLPRQIKWGSELGKHGTQGRLMEYTPQQNPLQRYLF